jgi:4-nitrophenyl phosphatase
METQTLLLGSIRFLLADLDGVLYRGSEALPGAAEFVAWLREHGIATLFITNNSTRTPEQFAEKLARSSC